MQTSTMSEFLSFLGGSEAISSEQMEQLIGDVRSGEGPRQAFKESFEEQLAAHSEQWASDKTAAMKVAQGYFALSDYSAVLTWLDRAEPSLHGLLMKAHSLRRLGQYREAIGVYEDAEAKGAEPFDMAMAVVDCLISAGELDQAGERLKRSSRLGDIRAEYHFQQARLYGANGEHLRAIEEYEQAVSLDPKHTRALFHLAYTCDLYGDEEEAVEYYRRCIESGPTHITALLNLAVLYEDDEDYFHAEQCVRRVLDAFPNHPRARMFYKDIEASKTMYYDEDQEKRNDRRNQVLEIPISDFELSVRSRNCLKKMNIRVLGDLLKVTENDLLAYKNFGETSLMEIKTILNQKGLRLGQMLEDAGGGVAASDSSEPSDEVDQVMGASVDELELSVRSRKCLQRLNINTMGDLCGRTDAELLGCKNFGVTSLTEIKQRLKDRGLSLRKLD